MGGTSCGPLVVKSINREDRPAKGAPSKGTAQNKRQEKTTTPREETASTGSRKAKGIWRFVRIQARPEQERPRKGTTSFTFSDRITAPKFER